MSVRSLLPSSPSLSLPRIGLSADARGQTEVLGTALMVSMILTSSMLIVGLTGMTLHSSQQHAEEQVSDLRMAEIETDVAQIAASRTGMRTSTAGLRTALGPEVTEDGHITVTTSPPDSSDSVTLVDTQLRTLEYETTAHGTVALQGGAVIREGSDGDQWMRSNPPLSFNSESMTFSITRFNADSQIGKVDHYAVEKTSEETAFPNPDKYSGNDDFAGENPLYGNSVEIQVESEYYEAWGEYLKENGATGVTYDHDNQVVEATLIEEQSVPDTAEPTDEVTPVEMDSAVHITSAPASSEYVQDVNGVTLDGENCDLLIFCSSNDGAAIAEGAVGSDWTYSCGRESNDAFEVHSRAGIEAQSYGDICADLYSKQDVYLGEGVTVGGDVQHETGYTCDDCDGPTGSVSSPALLETDYDPINSYIREYVSKAEQDNHNHQTDAISGNRLAGDSSVTLESGRYYLENGDFSGTNINFDVSNGDIVLVVDSRTMTLSQATVDNTVENNNVYIIFAGREVSMESGTEFRVADPKTESPNAWIYGPSQMSLYIQDESILEAAVFAPSDPQVDGIYQPESMMNDAPQIVIERGSTGEPTGLYGGLVASGQNVQVTNHGAIWMHPGLTGEQVLPINPDLQQTGGGGGGGGDTPETRSTVRHIYITVDEVLLENSR